MRFKLRFIVCALFPLIWDAIARTSAKNDPVAPLPATQSPECVLPRKALSPAPSLETHLQSQASRANSPPPEPYADATENWDLQDTGLSPEEIAPFLADEQPESIVYFDRSDFQRIYPLQTSSNSTTRTLFIGEEEFVRETAREREERAAERAETETVVLPARSATPLEENAYEIVFFHPGKRDRGETLVSVARDLLAAIQGPDYSLLSVDANDSQKMTALLSTVLSFGHGGELLLKAKENGYLLNESGFDFTIYENAFRIADTTKIFQEFGSVGASESPDPASFRWFECDPRNGIVRGCFGAVPTSEGGDQFDLSEVGLKKAKFIWIKDLGINKNYPSKWPTEGCDLDALRFIHAYRDS